MKMLYGYHDVHGNPPHTEIVDTGRLFDSIEAEVNVINANVYQTVVGTDVPYAEYVHDGTYKLKGRPFITDGINESKDCLRWVDFIIETFGKDTVIFLSGISMGAATVLMASDLELPKVVGIMADCGYTSPRAIIKKVIGDMHLPHWPILPLTDLWCRLLAKFSYREYSTVKAVSRSKVPILFVHGKVDNFVPCAMTEETYGACTSEKELILVEQAGHGLSFLVERERCEAAARAFMERCR
jgi:homoserine acetyltransferase